MEGNRVQKLKRLRCYALKSAIINISEPKRFIRIGIRLSVQSVAFLFARLY